jgi:hypothetical protein
VAYGYVCLYWNVGGCVRMEVVKLGMDMTKCAWDWLGGLAKYLWCRKAMMK